MKINQKALLLLLFGLAFCTVYSQAVGAQPTVVIQLPDSTQQVQASDNPEEYDDIPFKAAFMVMIMIGTAFLVGCIIAGTLVTVGLLLALFMMVLLGVVSSAVVVALYQKSFEQGFRTFVLLLCGSSGLTLGAFAFGVANHILHWTDLYRDILLGAGCGLVAGLVLGYVNLLITKRLTDYFRKFLQLR